MVPSARLRCLQFVTAVICCLPLIQSAVESDIQWPKGLDAYDEHLISLARSRRQAPSADVDDAEALTTVSTPTATGKNFTKINWTEVEDNWKKVLTEEEVKQKWDAMEKNTREGVRSILRQIFPRIVSMSSDAKVSGNCSAGILKWIISLRHLKGWAIKMLDAIGKPPAGVLEGAITMFGNHKQCLDIRAPDDEDEYEEEEEAGPPKFKEFFRGKYCILELKPWLPKRPRFYGFIERIESLKRQEGDDSVFAELSELAIFLHFVSIRVDLCLPSICSKDDIQRVANFLAKMLDFRARVSRCEVQSDQFVDVSYRQAATLVLAVGSIFVVLTATAVAVVLPLIGRKNSLPSMVRAFSLTNSFNELAGLENYQKKPKLATLYGLRFILILWIVMVHTITIVNYQFFREMQTIKDLALKRGLQFLTNSSLQYSSLIFLSAFCLGYYNDGRGLFKALKTIIKKYFRITPAIMAAVSLIILFPLLDIQLLKGPTWGDFINNRTETCQNVGWRNLFFIQNFWHPAQTCLPESWIFCVEMQLGLLFAIILGVMSSLRKRGSDVLAWSLLAATVVLGFVFNFIEVYNNDLPPTWLWTLPDPEQRDEYFATHMQLPWTHLSVYAIGVACGLLCRSRKKGSAGGPYGKAVTRLIGWAFSGLIMAIIIFHPHDWVMGNLPEETFSGLYDGLHRIVWAAVFSWIVFMVVADVEDKEETLVTRILGNKTMILFGRLSLTAYAIHPIVQLLLLSTQQTHLFSGPVLLPYVAIGNLTITYLLAFVLTIFVELPTSSLFCARESTAVKEEEITKFGKPTTYAISSSRNGDIEMKGKEARM